MRSLPLILAVAVAVALGAGGTAVAAQAAPATTSETALTYTEAQASRGGQWYAAACESCHPTRDMSSPDFKARWSGMRALDLYAIISTQMPQNEPGSLTRRTYADIVAYLMQLNGVPAGTSLLTADSTVLAATRLSFGTAPTGK